MADSLGHGQAPNRPQSNRFTSSAYLLNPSRSPSRGSNNSHKLYDESALPVAPRDDGAGKGEREKHPLEGLDAIRLGSSFFLFGMLIAMQFSVVVAAAGDLVGDQAPKSAVLTAYTIPSVTVRLLVPFATVPKIKPLLRRIPLVRSFVPKRSRTTFPKASGPVKQEEEVNYALRMAVCTACSFFGLNLLAWTTPLGIRLLGIALASCSSNLGDLSFYQMSTRYPDNITQSVGLYTSGGGAAGLVGALTYTVLTQLGASPSAVISGTGLVPLIVVLLYNFWLPAFPQLDDRAAGGDDKLVTVGRKREGMIKDLGTRGKLSLAKPMLRGFMVPMCVLFFVELTNVQGVLSTVIFYIPFLPGRYAFPSLLNDLFPARRSFYPLYQTIYQLAAFIGRSTATLFRLPGGSRQDPTSLWALIGTETLILGLQMRESMSMFGKDDAGTLYGPWPTLFLVLAMGICGGMTLANVYYRIGRHPLPDGVWDALARARRRRRLEGAIEYAALRREEMMDEEAGSEDEERESDIDEEEAVQDEIEALEGRGRATSTLRPVRLSRNPSLASIKGTANKQRERLAEDDASLREFVISSIGAADTLAILLASLFAMVIEPKLCRRQVETGRLLCASQS